jgi:hypothetical protein
MATAVGVCFRSPSNLYTDHHVCLYGRDTEGFGSRRASVTFTDPEKIRELARRGGAWRDAESRQMLEHAIETGRGGIYLRLTPAQYASLGGRNPSRVAWGGLLTSVGMSNIMPSAKPYKPPYAFSVTIGENCARQMRTFADLAEKLKMPVEDLMRQCNGKVSPSKALVKGLAKELGIDESYLEKLAAEVRKDLE